MRCQAVRRDKPAPNSGPNSGPSTRIHWYPLVSTKWETHELGAGEGAINVNTVYDGMGRVKQVSNPYYQGATPKYATQTYDGLGRTIRENLATAEQHSEERDVRVAAYTLMSNHFHLVAVGDCQDAISHFMRK